ncbi:uncharacterized protein DEA37_0009748 [Paragonimus westermani]|uniref:Uncharacterized protein n=1 Tax=Paragonimus westermani TaxID=34504 RepID=A0A5J4NYP3_9TREM|nr:uncharacterized protein DEA37_0009748 [Paragonimus westermani]
MPSIEIRVEDQERSMFKSKMGTAFSCLGGAVGTGNIWRFPRILASQSYSKGELKLAEMFVVIKCAHWSSTEKTTPIAHIRSPLLNLKLLDSRCNL